MTDDIEIIEFEKKIRITITPQAQKILKSSKYSLEEFKEWALNDQQISLGGHNVTLFLEEMYNRSKK